MPRMRPTSSTLTTVFERQSRGVNSRCVIVHAMVECGSTFYKAIEKRISTSAMSTQHHIEHLLRYPRTPGDPVEVHLWITDDGRWRGYTFTLVYARGELTGLNIERKDDAGVLTAAELQRVPLGALDRAARNAAAERLQRWYEPNTVMVANEAELQHAWEAGHNVMMTDDLGLRRAPTIEDMQAIFGDALLNVPEPGTQRNKDDVRLARLAKRYVELDGARGWRRTLGKELGWSESSIQTMVSRARKRGLLTHVRPGRYGGQLTPRARFLLGDTRTEETKR